jgi:hypothetical protein
MPKSVLGFCGCQGTLFAASLRDNALVVKRAPCRAGIYEGLPPETMTKKSSSSRWPAGFIETMDCLPVSGLPEGLEWTYEIKLDEYRLEAVRSAGRTTLYSRRQKSCAEYRAASMGRTSCTNFSGQKPQIDEGWADVSLIKEAVMGLHWPQP